MGLFPIFWVETHRPQNRKHLTLMWPGSGLKEPYGIDTDRAVSDLPGPREFGLGEVCGLPESSTPSSILAGRVATAVRACG